MAARNEGEGIVANANGKLINWLINTGDKIGKGDILGYYEIKLNDIAQMKQIVCDKEEDSIIKKIMVGQEEDFNVGQMLLEIHQLERLIISSKVTGKLTNLYVKEGEVVSSGQLLALIQPSDKSISAKYKRMRSPSCCRIEKILRHLGEELPAKTPVIQLVVEECKHSTIIRDMCATCGKDLSKSKKDVEIQKSMVTMVPNVPDLVVSQDLASELAKNDMNRLLSSKKLVLIVDLDLTLIHTRMASPDIKLSNLTEEKQIYYTCHMFPGYNVYHQYLTKLRPHVEEFLKVASTLFELHVVTMGSRSYAQDIVGILDPTGSLFYNRILSRDELKSQLLKSTNLNQLFPLGDNLVCIIDDRPEMWAFHPSCIPVPPYSYFANVGDINDPKKLNSKGLKTRDSPDVKENKPVDNNCNTDVNQLEESSPMNQINADSNELNGQSTTECIEKPKITDEKHATSTNDSSGDSRIDTNNNNDDEEIATRQRPSLWKTAVDSDTNIAYYDIKDNYLLNLLPLLQRIHNRFYQQYDQLKEQLDQLPDLKSIIPEIRRNVLKDVKIVFSAIIPSGHPSPEKTYEWILAESLGAKVTHKFHTSPSRKTTHVVTKRVAFQSGYTQKVHLAMKTAGVFVVDIDWLYKCNEFWKKIEEEPYLLAPVCMCSSTRMQLMPKEKRRKSLELQTERFSKRKRTSLDERNETSVGLMMAPDFGLAKELTRRSSSRESSLDSFSISSSSSSCSLSSKSTDSSATESSIDSECEAIGAILEAQLADVN